VEPRGGYFVWLELPNDMHASALLPRAKAAGVTFHPGGRFVSRDGFAQAMRLSFAHYDAPTLVEGVERLARTIAEYERAAP
jgi:2-aminoadipate transaminase